MVVESASHITIPRMTTPYVILRGPGPIQTGSAQHPATYLNDEFIRVDCVTQGLTSFQTSGRIYILPAAAPRGRFRTTNIRIPNAIILTSRISHECFGII